MFGKEVDDKVVFNKLKSETHRHMWRYSKGRAQGRLKDRQVEMWGNGKEL